MDANPEIHMFILSKNVDRASLYYQDTRQGLWWARAYKPPTRKPCRLHACELVIILALKGISKKNDVWRGRMGATTGTPLGIQDNQLEYEVTNEELRIL